MENKGRRGEGCREKANVRVICLSAARADSRPSSLIKIMQDGTLKRAELAGLARTLAPSHTPLNTRGALHKLWMIIIAGRVTACDNNISLSRGREEGKLGLLSKMSQECFYLSPREALLEIIPRWHRITEEMGTEPGLLMRGE